MKTIERLIEACGFIGYSSGTIYGFVTGNWFAGVGFLCAFIFYARLRIDEKTRQIDTEIDELKMEIKIMDKLKKEIRGM